MDKIFTDGLKLQLMNINDLFFEKTKLEQRSIGGRTYPHRCQIDGYGWIISIRSKEKNYSKSCRVSVKLSEINTNIFQLYIYQIIWVGIALVQIAECYFIFQVNIYPYQLKYLVTSLGSSYAQEKKVDSHSK